MTGPRNGGTRPTSVATPMSQGSAIRRRASLNVQYAVASQRSTSTTSAVFFVSDQPCDPEIASRANIVRAEACRPNSRVQRMCRRARRRRLARTSPLPGARLPSTRRVLLLRGLAELVGTCERRDGAVDRLDVLEVPTRGASDVGRRQSALRRRAGGDEIAPGASQDAEDLVRVLVGKDRDDDRPVPRRKPVDEKSRTVGIVSTVPDLCIPALETSRELNRLRSSDRVADKGLRGLARRASRRAL